MFETLNVVNHPLWAKKMQQYKMVLPVNWFVLSWAFLPESAAFFVWRRKMKVRRYHRSRNQKAQLIIISVPRRAQVRIVSWVRCTPVNANKSMLFGVHCKINCPNEVWNNIFLNNEECIAKSAEHPRSFVSSLLTIRNSSFYPTITRSGTEQCGS